uniref:C-type lectin domain-containing protein n=1 Tax=Branchiostoma floridae TaxID=7739 RepID=C4A0W3_BRAFL|eukprot:XP_002585557.1 hypothetical protein BRAFLDRAFT_111836 [Branchiostoma floridae]
MTPTAVMTTTEGPCPPCYELFQENCYKVFEETLRYEGSVETCSKDGGILATPRDRTTDQFLIGLKNRATGSEYVRIGLTDRAQEGVLVWSDGSPLRKGDYSPWTRRLRNNGLKNCVEYVRADYNIHSLAIQPNKWQITSCDWNQMFICQVTRAFSNLST